MRADVCFARRELETRLFRLKHQTSNIEPSLSIMKSVTSPVSDAMKTLFVLKKSPTSFTCENRKEQLSNTTQYYAFQIHLLRQVPGQF